MFPEMGQADWKKNRKKEIYIGCHGLFTSQGLIHKRTLDPAPITTRVEAEVEEVVVVQ